MSTFSPNLRVELIANGDQSGTWGTTTNTNLGTILEDAIAGYVSVSVTSANQAFTALNGAADEARNQTIRLTTTTTANFAVYAPPAEKIYVIVNASAYTATIYASTVIGNTTAAGTGVAIPAGKKMLVYCDGTNFAEQLNYVAGDFGVGGNQTVTGNLTVTGNFNASGSPTINNNLQVTGSTFLGTSQTASIAVTSPTIITVASSPETNSAVTFSTTGTLPTGITAGTTYYVSKINSTTFFISASPTLTPLVNVTLAGSGVHTVSTVSLAVTSPTGANNTQLATTAFVNNALANIPVSLTNWSVSETSAAQTATMTIASPAVVTVTTAPAAGTAVAFTTTGSLPTGVTAGTPYYVFNPASTTYNLATTSGTAQTAITPIASPGVVTVTAAPSNGDVVTFTTTGALPTGITAGTNYYVINRTSTTFQIAATSGGTAINFTGTQSGTQTATWRTLVNTSGSQSGTHTENTSKMYFKYKTVNKMSIDLGGNIIATANVTAFGTP